MKPFEKVTGKAVPLPRADVDTDQIIPAEFLKRVERTGYGEFLFFRWSTLTDGAPNPMFVLNEPRYAGANILLTGPNFGCGSSREHAAWALKEAGFRVILAPSFADIFYDNCYQNGLLPVRIEQQLIETMTVCSLEKDEYRVTVNLERETVTDSEGLSAEFQVDPFRRKCLLEGWDSIDLTLQHEQAIEKYEQARGQVG